MLWRFLLPKQIPFMIRSFNFTTRRYVFVNLLLRATPPAHGGERGGRLPARRARCSPADGEQNKLIPLYSVASTALHRMRNSALLREGLPPLAEGPYSRTYRWDIAALSGLLSGFASKSSQGKAISSGRSIQRRP